MNSSDPVADALRSGPIPPTPANLAGEVRRRLRRRALRQRGLVAVLVAAVVAAVLLWRPWGGSPVAPPDLAVVEIPAEEIEVLFAPPPIDPLAILTRQDRSTMLALSRLEEAK